MKQKDTAMLLVIVFLSAVASFFASGLLFKTSPGGNGQPVEVVQKIDSDFPPPDRTYFNEKAIDPTQLIRITNNANTTPFVIKKTE